MKIELRHSGVIIGEIFPTLASRKTREIKGLLIPTKAYLKVRANINKYHEIYHNPKANNGIDSFIDKQLEKKYIKMKGWFKNFRITVADIPITDDDSEIRIIDNLTKTGLGNIEISVEAWNLVTENIFHDFKTYSIEYPYPSQPRRIIEVKDGVEVLFRY